MSKRALDEDTPKDTPKDDPDDFSSCGGARLLGVYLAKCDRELKGLGLPSLHQAIAPVVNAFCETDGCDEETLEPFGVDNMHSVLEMAKNDNERYRAIINGPAFKDAERADSTSTLNLMQAIMSLAIIAETLEQTRY